MTPPIPSLSEAEEILSAKVSQIITDAARLGVSASQLIDIISRRCASFDKLTVGK